MARRTLSMQGRILAAGVSVAVGGALVGVMAAGDHTADARAATPDGSTTASSPISGGGGNASATPFDGQSSAVDDTALPGGTGFQSEPQPQTRTGGS